LALQAAVAIYTDFKRGFIKAEAVAYVCGLSYIYVRERRVWLRLKRQGCIDWKEGSMLCRIETLFISGLVSCDSWTGRREEELMNTDAAPEK